MQHTRIAWTAAFALGMAVLLCITGDVAAQAGSAPQVTFTKDVAPLLQENCQSCHREDGIGPMEFMTYDQVRPWAPIIREKVSMREMPPYQYDTDVGIQELQNDWRLSDEEISTFIQWIDQGAPEGNPTDMPAPKTFNGPAEWRLTERFGPPDLIVPAKPYDVPAIGQDIWWEPLVEIPIDQDQYVMAIEVKPSLGGRKVVHHANTTLYLPDAEGELQGQGGRFTEYAVGKLGEIIPDGAGRLLPANSLVRWSIHYYPMGEAVENEVTELAFWFHPEDYEPEYSQDLKNYRLQGDLIIPPHEILMTQGFHSWDHPVRIDSFQPHGHLRLRGSSIEIFHPDTGEREVVSMVSNQNAWWQHSHLYEPDSAPLIPAGAVMVLTHWYDNTENNPNNPDPEQWVYPGSRTGDEMQHDWIAVSHLSQEQYEQLKAEREARVPVTGDQ